MRLFLFVFFHITENFLIRGGTEKNENSRKQTEVFEELSLYDPFMFAKVLNDPEKCRGLFERVIGEPVKSVPGFSPARWDYGGCPGVPGRKRDGSVFRLCPPY